MHFCNKKCGSGDRFRRDFTLKNLDLSDIIKYITESS